MRYLDTMFLVSLLLCALQGVAQDVERKRPEGWDNLVEGARFMDRFLPMQQVGKSTSSVWGQQAVLPRCTRNGLEDSTYSYWGGNIYKDSTNHYNLFVCRWLEDHPKGHMAWPKSTVVHAQSETPYGPYSVKKEIGVGHNPEMVRLKDGRYLIYVNQFSGDLYYITNSLNEAWEKHPFTVDPRDRPIPDHLANNTFAKRTDGSVLMVSRGGGVFISPNGLPPYQQLTSESVYPKYEGKYEDPVVWRTNIQYHLIVNDWLGRIAYHMRSKDGVHWKLDAGEAYMPGIAKRKDGTEEGWYKYERMKVLQDKYGRAFLANFAVCDTIKKQDKGNDNHSSKNLCIPMTVGRLMELKNMEKINASTQTLELLVKSEPGFNAQKDMDVKSLRLGAPEKVDFGSGCKLKATKCVGKDLLLVFDAKGHGLTDDNFVVKLLGKTKKGALLYGYARLPWLDYNQQFLSAKYPSFALNSRNYIADMEVQNFGQVPSEESTYRVEYLKNDNWVKLSEGKVPSIKPYAKTTIRFEGRKFANRECYTKVRITLLQPNQAPEILCGGVVIR